jgi:ABC-type transport system involved in cytochrome bd biosynthesis fused ATPase/permease subunit
VIYQCGLKRDISLFDAGDATEIGEKGLTLSGGQKARISLARAVYSSASTILFDDILAALDVHTSVWIVNKCLKGELVKGRTVLLVTHNVALTTPIADFVVSLGTDGRIISQGAPTDTLITDKALAEEIAHEQEALELEDDLEEQSEQSKAAAKGSKVTQLYFHVQCKSI